MAESKLTCQMFPVSIGHAGLHREARSQPRIRVEHVSEDTLAVHLDAANQPIVVIAQKHLERRHELSALYQRRDLRSQSARAISSYTWD